MICVRHRIFDDVRVIGGLRGNVTAIGWRTWGWRRRQAGRRSDTQPLPFSWGVLSDNRHWCTNPKHPLKYSPATKDILEKRKDVVPRRLFASQLARRCCKCRLDRGACWGNVVPFHASARPPPTDEPWEVFTKTHNLFAP